MFLRNLTGKLFQNFRKTSFYENKKLSTATSSFILNSKNGSHALTTKLLAEGNGGKKIVGYWLAGTSAAVFGMIVFGGLTRLTESGLSMVDWKLIHFSAPKNDDEWRAYFEKYKEFPEYLM
jgi:heme a synthase